MRAKNQPDYLQPVDTGKSVYDSGLERQCLPSETLDFWKSDIQHPFNSLRKYLSPHVALTWRLCDFGLCSSLSLIAHLGRLDCVVVGVTLAGVSQGGGS